MCLWPITTFVVILKQIIILKRLFYVGLNFSLTVQLIKLY